MLTVEYRVNGQLIGFTNITNVCCEDKQGNWTMDCSEPNHKCMYNFDHKPISITGMTSGTVKHKRTDGFEKLVLEVLKKIVK